jgi:predicted double-glycine peptidase
MLHIVRICLLAALPLCGCASQSRVEIQLHSWKWHRDHNLVKQGFDYSCGAGALATLMRYYFRDEVSETDVLQNILGVMSEQEVHDREKNGLSLLDLKQCSERMGYQAAAAKLKYAALPKLKGPVLVHMEHDDYKHFAVLKGVKGDRVFLADPSNGNIQMSVERFSKQWTGYSLVLGKRGFGLPQDHALAIGEAQLLDMEMLAVRGAIYAR